MAHRAKGHVTPHTDRTIAGANWEDRDISAEHHTLVAFDDLDLTEATNTGATFSECTFRRARFNVSRHTDAAFVNCTFQSCSFFDAHFTDCKFVGSRFERCTFDLMRVTGGNWSFVAMAGADLHTASFRDTRLREADLTGARCQGASMRDLDLSGANLRGVNFTESDLRGSDLSAIEPGVVELSGAIITMEQALVIATALGLDVRAE